MKKRLQKELHILAASSSRIFLLTILAVFGGILLWVHGSMAPLVFRSCRMPPAVPGFTLCFLMWLVVYALAGCELGIQLLPVYFHGREGLRECLMCLLAYMLTLAWYPLFFSVLHTFLSALLLGVAVFLHFWLCFCSGRRGRILVLPYFLSCLLEIYFLCVTISFMLLN